MNKSDSERISGYLEEVGYKEEKERNNADLIILNTCGVRQSAEDRAYGLISRIKKENPNAKIVLTGCLSERNDVKRRLKEKVDIWLPIIKLPELSVKLGIKGKKFDEDYLKILPKYNNQISAFVPIGNGCDNFCTYCVVPNARGREVYRQSDEIIAEVKNLVKKGFKEIILIAQNVNSYKTHNTQHTTHNKELKDIYFVDLLKMVNDMPGDFWIRFATSHPKDMSDDLIKAILDCGNVCEHVHLPAQSGDNEILKAMNRNYSRDQYLALIKKIRKKIPMASITTDIIVGFPGETKEQFNNTKKLFKEAKYDMAYIARYSPRPGTAANELVDDVSQEEKKAREDELMKILRITALKNNGKYIGKIVDMLVEGKNKKGELYGKTVTNKVVKVKSRKLKVERDRIGEFVKVKILNVRDFGLEGVILK